MTEAYEWFDPHEEKQRADREARRANAGEARGREQVESVLGRAERNRLTDKLEMAADGLAERIGREAMYLMAARLAYRDVAEQCGPAVADIFRSACARVIGEITPPDVSRLTTRVNPNPAEAGPEMVIEFEVLRPVRVGYAFPL